MQKALLLIKATKPGDIRVYRKLKEHPKIVEANMIYGPYDLYGICEEEGPAGIKQIVLDVRNLPGVVNTTTCPMVE
ncbi:MAG: Lrp/AsnC ligand binding domain-containing protein [Candidatus Bathyarchaeia archaeon]